MVVQSKFGTVGPDAPAAAPSTRLSRSAAHSRSVLLRTLVLIRWVAIAGQVTTILFVGFVLRYDFSLTLTLAAVGVSVLLNVVLTLRYPAAKRLSDSEAAWYLAYDTVQLAVLLFLTGGLSNPFSFLMLGPAMISATVLSKRATFLLVGLSLACVSVLAIVHLPLPWPGGKQSISDVYVFGIWSALLVGMVFFSINVLQVAEEGRRMLDALTETQMVLAREQRLSELGALAAAAAHELGTPLGTIALVAKELKRDLTKDCRFADDLKLLVSQSERCRDILARLTLRSEDGVATSIYHMPFIAVVEMAVDMAERARCREDVGIMVDHAPELVGAKDRGAEDKRRWAVGQPIVPHRLEIVHGIKNLIENAVDFARTQVSVKVGWSGKDVTVEITDDGPGFARGILGALGEPYVSTRREAGSMGLGVFIAKTLLERTGAEVCFGNREGDGAQIVITWPRALLVERSRTAEDVQPPADNRMRGQ